MVTTGIVRKIDDLGRIVLPKEMRSNLNISSGDDFEILINEDDIVLRRYSKIKNKNEDILKIVSLFNSNIKFKLYLIVSGCLFDSGEKVLNNIIKLINERKIIKNTNPQNLTDKIELSSNNIIYPIVNDSTIIGAIVGDGNEGVNRMEEFCRLLALLIIDKIVE